MKKLTQEQQSTLNNLLYDAARDGKLFLVKFLINFGADIHANDNGALFWASYHGYFEIVKYLVEHGADIHADNDYAINIAATKEIKEYLESKIKNDNNN